MSKKEKNFNVHFQDKSFIVFAGKIQNTRNIDTMYV